MYMYHIVEYYNMHIIVHSKMYRNKHEYRQDKVHVTQQQPTV